MMKATESIATSWDKCFNLPNNGLRAYFSRVATGSPKVIRTTFYKGTEPSSVLSSWAGIIAPLQAKWPTLMDFEEEMRGKVGPLSVMKPLSQRMSDIDAYYTNVNLPAEPLLSEAIDAACEWFSPVSGIRLRGQGNTVEHMQLSTNSGAPYFTKRRNVVDGTIPCILRDGQIHTPGSEWTAVAVLGWRGQEGGPSPDDVKQRVVWMFPFSVNVCELQFYQPLIEGCQKHSLVPAWIGMDAVDREITALFDTSNEELIICTDFSKFDQHFNSVMQDGAFQVFNRLGGEAVAPWLEHVFPVKYNIPLAYNWNRIRTGPHGMGSGSGGTNADETVTHRILQYEAAIQSGQELNPHSMCLGDDGLLSYKGIKVEDVVDAYSSHGQEMNVTKQYVSREDCVYLRRWHHRDYRVNNTCVGVYSTFRALGRLMYQERFYDPDKWSEKMVALRQLSILENVKWHPMREEFAEFCMKGDKFRLGLDIPGFLDNIEAYAKEATAYMPDFLGYTKSQQRDAANVETGIKDWWIVQYLKSRA